MTLAATPIVLALGLVGLPIPLAPAAGPGLPDEVFAAPSEADGIEDIVFFGPTRPAFIRLRVEVNGKPFRAAWEGFVLRLHQYLDADGDGRLTTDEAGRGVWQQVVQAPFGNNGMVNRAVNRAGLDVAPKDGRVSLEELASYLRSSLSFEEFGLQPGEPPDERTLASFAHLDRDGDKALSPSELDGAEGLIPRLDGDEDEIVTLAELKPDDNPSRRFFVVESSSMRLSPDTNPFVPLSSTAALGRAARRLLVKYDRYEADGSQPKDGVLSPVEIGLDPPTFARFDADGSGGLDRDELATLLTDPPASLTLSVRLKPGGSSVEVADDGGAAPAIETRRSRNAGLIATLDGIEVEFRSGDNTADYGNFFEQQFKNADADNNGYLEKKEADQDGNFQAIFPAADRDGDGKLFLEELKGYLARQADAIASRTMMSVSDLGQSLYDLLDADHDNRLSLRELRGAPSRLRALDRDGDGTLAEAEVPRHYLINVGRGPTVQNRGFALETYDSQAAANLKGTVEKPSWFLRMDRNRDGDVSRLEFLGPPEDFARVDADGDGLIDAREAARAR